MVEKLLSKHLVIAKGEALLHCCRKQCWVLVQHLEQILPIPCRVVHIRSIQRPVTAGWRVMGLRYAPCFVNAHRVLQRARWSPLAARHRWRRVLGTRCAPAGALGCGLADTIARRRGDKIAAYWRSRDPVRSSPAQVVTARGVRWRCWMLWTKVS
jgi:hypothetical protein